MVHLDWGTPPIIEVWSTKDLMIFVWAMGLLWLSKAFNKG